MRNPERIRASVRSQACGVLICRRKSGCTAQGDNYSGQWKLILANPRRFCLVIVALLFHVATARLRFPEEAVPSPVECLRICICVFAPVCASCVCWEAVRFACLCLHIYIYICGVRVCSAHARMCVCVCVVCVCDVWRAVWFVCVSVFVFVFVVCCLCLCLCLCSC